ncbi:hypothetical protein Xcel_0596 [Xylanimonas cellulosilytica DSM 15894]|uniref:Uncharacterized protein n=2 Tax=Xylanimonas TaxID=186188 RepID=D1BWQ3_XYLCX|nr:hypothetical protein Xcel_0596 [Xylanimonas cellulosilytica DSM 15894]
MPATTPGDRDRARVAVAAAITQRGKSPTAAAGEMGIDQMTLLGFVNGDRWPRAQKRTAIEQWLGWAPGAIDDIVRGAPSPDDSATVTAGRVHLDVRAGDYTDLAPAELNEAVTVATASFLERVRQIRAARPRD